MLKALIIGADALCPEYIFEHLERYPNLSKLIDAGACSSYSAYVQRGYHGSYVSEMNWPSIYTGLAPWDHHIAARDETGICRKTAMGQMSGMSPLWDAANRAGLTVGWWNGLCCEEPVEVNGYAIAAQFTPVESPSSIRTARRTLQVCKKDRPILDMIRGEAPPRLYPRTLEQQGWDFEQLRRDPALAMKAIEAYHFQDALKNFEEELEFFFQAMCEVQKQRPVDVLYFYTPTTDLIAHCAMYCDDCDTLISAYQLLDQYVGKWVEALCPNNVVVMSDHGMANFKDLVASKDEKIRREALAARDEVIWLPNGYIAFEAHNGALLFTYHALKGTFIAAGKEIRHSRIAEMRTLDIYPTLLEMLGAEIPAGREGYVQDIFARPLYNSHRAFPAEKAEYDKVAVLECVNPSMTDIVLNELYVRNRFARFTVVGDERYGEIYRGNPRTTGFVSYSDFDPAQFDAVYCGIYREKDGLTGHIRVH